MDGVATWHSWPAGSGRATAQLPRLLAIVCCVIAVAEFAVRFGSQHRPVGTPGSHSAPTPVGSFGALVVTLTLMCLASTLPVAFLGPIAAMVATSTANALALAVFEVVMAPAMLVQVVSGYRLGRSGAQVVVAVAGLPFLLIALVGPSSRGVQVPAVLLASLPLVAGLVGSALRSQEKARIGSERSAALNSDLARQAAQRERTRIARDMHDTVAHHMSTISVQAETARLATPGMPPEGAQRLHAIAETARTALTELRGLLGVLRGEDPIGENRRPQPGLADLNDLIDAARQASGAAVRLVVCGSAKQLDPGIELTAYRIVQEALTNARRHAPGAATDVELHFQPEVLVVRVRDNGPGSTSGPGQAPGGTGFGLRGMGERAIAVGGSVTAGPGPVTGFVVEAVLPNTVREAS